MASNILSIINDDFMLKSKTAKDLYHNYASKMPIYDYHCHLDAKDIYEDRVYSNISEIWFGDDHYKWRAMRVLGIDEYYITGSATPKEKFKVYAETISVAIGNPLYHWTHLELLRYFNVSESLNEKNWESIWNQCNQVIKEKKLSPRKLIAMSNVSHIYTTDDPTDRLDYHKLLIDEAYSVSVRPTFRPDSAFQIDKTAFKSWIKQLGKVVNISIASFGLLIEALKMRIDYFDTLECNIADHGMDYVDYGTYDKVKAIAAFDKAMNDLSISEDEIRAYKSYLQYELGKLYHSKKWVMQLHIGALRDANTLMVKTIGHSKGYDAINDRSYAEPLANMLDDLDKSNQLPKTIVYNLNPRDNYMLAALAGCYNEEGIKGKVQFGSGWWFCDQKEGMLNQLKALSNLGMISSFVGMLTDSRSYLSYTRHEYFRRILCNYFAELIDEGEFVLNIEKVGGIVEDICYNNAIDYFKETKKEV